MNKTVFATGEANDATILQNAVYKNALAGGGHLNALRRFVLFRQRRIKKQRLPLLRAQAGFKQQAKAL